MKKKTIGLLKAISIDWLWASFYMLIDIGLWSLPSSFFNFILLVIVTNRVIYVAN